MDHLAIQQYDTYALDFLGYGDADRSSSMAGAVTGVPTGRAEDVYKDVDSAVNYILQRTGSSKLYLIAHSWGGSVAALYASKYPDKIDRLVLFSALTEKQEQGNRK
jgi:pimeloyl-ACP methyl ester carboxylesterase